MSAPGWHPNPDGSDSMRYWDGQQWTTVAPKNAPTLAERTVQTPEQKKSNRKWLIGGGAVVAALVVASMIINGSADNEESTEAAATSEAPTPRPAATPAATAPVAPAPPARPKVQPPTVTRGAPAPAQTATEAGCDEPDPSIVSAIEGSLTEGRTLDQVAAVNTLVGGIEYTYTAGNVYKADGDRSVSGVVWITPGFGVMGLSGNSRTVSTLPFGRGILDVSAGDEHGAKVQDCVMALALGR